VTGKEFVPSEKAEQIFFCKKLKTKQNSSRLPIEKMKER
jgi:hypothetical protein